MKKLIIIITLLTTLLACEKEPLITDQHFVLEQLKNHGFVEINLHPDIPSGCPVTYSHGYAFTANRQPNSRRITLGSICWNDTKDVRIYNNGHEE